MGFLSDVIRDARGARHQGWEAAGAHPASMAPTPALGLASAGAEAGLSPDGLPPAPVDSAGQSAIEPPHGTLPASPPPPTAPPQPERASAKQNSSRRLPAVPAAPAAVAVDAAVTPPRHEQSRHDVAKAVPAAGEPAQPRSSAEPVAAERRKTDIVGATVGAQREFQVVAKTAGPASAAVASPPVSTAVEPSPFAPRPEPDLQAPAAVKQAAATASLSPATPSPERSFADADEPAQQAKSAALRSDGVVHAVAVAARPAQTGAPPPARQHNGVVDSRAAPVAPSAPQDNAGDRPAGQQAQAPAGPRVHIGQVDIVVTTAPREKPRRASGPIDKHLASRRYLRRL